MTEQFKEAIKQWLVNQRDFPSIWPRPVEIVSVEQDDTEKLAPFCGEGTCWGEYTVVKITYIDDVGDEDWYEYDGEYAEFIRALTNAS